MGTETPRIEVLWIALFASGFLACKQILGLDTPPDAQPAPPSPEAAASVDAGLDGSRTACGLPYATPTCASCVVANCCSETTACSTSPACNAYETCLGGCMHGDPACRAQCQIDHPPGTASEVSALSACLVTHCENDCGLACGALAGLAVEPDAAAAFQACLVSNGCGVVRACAISADCDAVNRCIEACTPGDCMDTCLVSHGVDPAWAWADGGETDATSTYASLVNANTACASAAGNYWECVGHVAWPQVRGAATTIFQTRVADSVSGGTLDRMTVAVCGSRDIDCTMPWATGNTDPSGLITLLVPLPMGPIDTTGYLKVTGPPANPTATVPTYEYWGFPLTQDHEVFGRASFVTPAESKSVANVIAAEFDGGFDPNLGVLVAVVIDCVDAPAPGAQVTLSPADPRTVAISDSNFAPAAPITNSNGVVVFVNVPAGPVTVTANPAAIARPSGTVGVTVRAGMGTTTIVIVPPTPL